MTIPVGRSQHCPKRRHNFLLFAAPASLIGSELSSLLGSGPLSKIETSVTILWYGGVAGDGLRSVGAEALPSSKSVCSILPIAICGPGLYGTPAFTMPLVL